MKHEFSIQQEFKSLPHGEEDKEKHPEKFLSRDKEKRTES